MTFAIFIFLVVALAMFTYILIYKHSINKRLEESREGIEPRRRAMIRRICGSPCGNTDTIPLRISRRR